ncbi:hypothetical protein CCY97_00695 [Helicobacter sp. 10-6591]|nr:hypothetical protein CCY97_00695 [Helicobacter sp. 10-6591]
MGKITKLLTHHPTTLFIFYAIPVFQPIIFKDTFFPISLLNVYQTKKQVKSDKSKAQGKEKW